MANSVDKPYLFGGFVTVSDRMVRTIDEACRLLQFSNVIVLYGETGTGKEGIGRHCNEKYGKGKPLAKIDISTLHDELAASDFFGVVPGAFTDAKKERRSPLETADVVFMDELQRGTPRILGMLLRFIEYGEFRQLGASEWKRTEAKIILASNQSPESLMEERGFPQDFYYRVKSFCIRIPSLEERGPDEKEFLAKHFLGLFCSRNDVAKKGFSAGALTFIRNYVWKGNCRELKNEVLRCAALSPSPVIDLDEFQHSLDRSQQRGSTYDPLAFTFETWKELYFRKHILQAQKESSPIGPLVRNTGISKKALYENARKYNLDIRRRFCRQPTETEGTAVLKSSPNDTDLSTT